MKKELEGIMLEVVQGDISRQEDVEAVVNAANAALRMGGGVAGAIHRVAGPGLEEECRPLAPIDPGEAVITSGHNLPNDYVIHCLGPVYGRDKPEDKLLGDCYHNALDLAEEEGIASIAFPAISTGAFGYPVRDAAVVAFEVVQEKLPELEQVQKIHFVLFNNHDLEVHIDVLQQIFDQE